MQWFAVGIVACLTLAFAVPGPAESITLGTVQLEVDRLAADDFSDGLAHWVVEGNSRVFVENGKLRIDTPDRGYATVWYRQPFEGDQLLRFQARVLPPRQASNINFFFCASLPEGGDFFAPKRTGAYAEYHQINNYTMTFTGRREERNAQGELRAPGYMRLRKNPGFRLVDENLDFKANIETDYDIAILKVGDRIRVFVNGTCSLDWRDVSKAGLDESLHGGHAGFRTFWSRLQLDDFRADRVESCRAIQEPDTKTP